MKHLTGRNKQNLIHTVTQKMGSPDMQRGQSTVEWGGLSLILVVLMVAITSFIGGGGGGPLASAISNTMGELVITLEGGGGNAGTPNQPGADVPNVRIPRAVVPNPSIPQFAVPSTAVAAIATTTQTVDAVTSPDSDSGGGFWGWVQSVGSAIVDGVTGAWDAVSNWFNNLPTWARGLIIGVAAAVVIVVGVVVLFAAGVIGGAVAIGAAIVGAVVAIGVGLWYGITHIGDAFNGWHAFLWALGGGIIGALAGGFIVAFWAPISAALAASWSSIVTGVTNFARLAWSGITSGLATAGRFIATQAANVWGLIQSGLTQLGLANALKWGALNSALTFAYEFVYSLVTGTDFSIGDALIASAISFVSSILTKSLFLGIAASQAHKVITTLATWFGGTVPKWGRRALAMAVSVGLAFRAGFDFAKQTITDWIFGKDPGKVMSGPIPKPTTTPPSNPTATPTPPNPTTTPTPPTTPSPTPTYPPTTTPAPPTNTPTPTSPPTNTPTTPPTTTPTPTPSPTNTPTPPASPTPTNTPSPTSSPTAPTVQPAP